MECPNCGFQNYETKICTYCGRILNSPEEPAKVIVELDGSSIEKAIVVDSFKEKTEWMLNNCQGLPLRHELQEIDGKMYNLHTLVNDKWERRTVYFDISSFYPKEGQEQRITSKRKPEKCTVCGSAKIARIQYGLVLDDSIELNKDIDEGKVVLGGCCITLDDPSWECIYCRTKIYKKARENGKDRNKEYNELLDRAKSNLKDAIKITDAKDTVQDLSDIVHDIEDMKIGG